MKTVLLTLIPAVVFLTGCMAFLPEGEPPDNPAGNSSVSRTVTLAMAESSMCTALTQAVIRLGITPVRYYAMPNVRRSFLQTLDPNLFQGPDERSYDYLLVASQSGDSWTLSLKRKNSEDFLWSKTITKIRKN